MRRTSLATVLALAASLAGCGNNNGRGGDGGSGADLGVPSGDLAVDPWMQDPPVTYCFLDGGFSAPPPPGGSADCPSDKNREGCPCPTEGMTAACWPGLRINRNLGQCMDGMTTCMKQSELSLVWGPCVGYVLPEPGATAGKAACKCFSSGQWRLDNLSPCLIDNGGGAGSGGAASSYLMGNAVTCPMGAMQPAQPWTTDTITADCEGHFKLCYTLKAGSVSNPGPNDCVVARSCTEGDYTMVNMAQSFPPLPSWISMDTACTKQFALGGYGEMSVTGTTLTCDMLDQVFLRVGYCPLYCNNPMDPNYNKTVCASCMQGGSGTF